MRRSLQTRFRLVWLVCLSSTGLGATAPDAGSLSGAAFPEAGVSLLRVSGALALVVGIFLAGVWLFKNWQRFVLKSKGAPRLKVIEVRPLGGRHALYLVGYDQQRLLLAASPSGIQFVTHLPDAEPETAPLPADFAKALDRMGAAPAAPAAREAL